MSRLTTALRSRLVANRWTRALMARSLPASLTPADIDSLDAVFAPTQQELYCWMTVKEAAQAVDPDAVVSANTRRRQYLKGYRLYMDETIESDAESTERGATFCLDYSTRDCVGVRYKLSHYTSLGVTAPWSVISPHNPHYHVEGPYAGMAASVACGVGQFGVACVDDPQQFVRATTDCGVYGLLVSAWKSDTVLTNGCRLGIVSRAADNLRTLTKLLNLPVQASHGDTTRLRPWREYRVGAPAQSSLVVVPVGRLVSTGLPTSILYESVRDEVLDVLSCADEADDAMEYDHSFHPAWAEQRYSL